MKTKISRRVVLQGILAGTTAFATMRVLPTMAQQSGGTLNVGLTYELDTMNTYSTGFLADAQHTVIEGLVAPDTNARYVPVLAKEVPTIENGLIVLSEDGSKMTVTYNLQENVKWHDGAPFTSADVKFTWEAVKDPAFIAESKDGTQDIDSIDTPDDLTVICNYNTVKPNFASTLFTFGIMPKHLLEGTDLNTSSYNETPVGTGPFKVAEFVRGQYVVLDKNTDYWRTAENGDALPYIDRLVFRIVTDSNTLITQLQSGELDMAVSVPYGRASQLEGVEGLEIIVGPQLSWGHLDFNFANELLADSAVRKAIAHAINRETLIRVQGGYPIPIKSLVLPLFDLYDDTTPEYAFDVAAANALLDEAGYTVGGDGIREKDGQRLSFNFVVQSGRADDENVQQVIIAQLKEIGIEATADNKAGVAYREARYTGGFDLIYGRWITSADPVYSTFYGSEGENNGQGYSNPELDAVFERLENTLDPEARKAAASEMQHIIAEDLPAIALFQGVSVIAKPVELKNFIPNPTNMTNFVDTKEWYLEG
jgi:peptide/nickel transport system substrate-binding protein